MLWNKRAVAGMLVAGLALPVAVPEAYGKNQLPGLGGGAPAAPAAPAAPRIQAPAAPAAPRVQAPAAAPAPRVQAPAAAPAPRVQAPAAAPAPRVQAPAAAAPTPRAAAQARVAAQVVAPPVAPKAPAAPPVAAPQIPAAPPVAPKAPATPPVAPPRAAPPVAPPVAPKAPATPPVAPPAATPPAVRPNVPAAPRVDANAEAAARARAAANAPGAPKVEADAAAAAAARARLNPNAPNVPNTPAANDVRRNAEAAQRNAAEQARDRAADVRRDADRAAEQARDRAPDVRRDADRAAEQARDRTNDARRSADDARRDAAEAARRNALDPAQRRADDVRRDADRAAEQARDRTNDARRTADEARRDAAEAAQRNALDPAQRRAAEVRRDADRAADQARDRANDVRRDANQDARRAEERADDVRRDANEARRDANQDARRSSRIANDPFGPNGFLRRPSDLNRDGVRDPNRRPVAIGGPNRFGPGRGFSIGVGPVGVNVGPRGGVGVNIGRGAGVTVNALRPAWAGNNNLAWQDTWRSHGVPHYHRNWYHGAWGQNGRATYSPWLWNSGLGWGYGWGNLGLNSGYYAYSNPYYTSQQAAVYDYSQPVQVAYYSEESQQPAQDQPAYALFDQGRESFRNQDFGASMRLFDQAAEKLPGDALIHEARALNLFALKRYPEAAAVLNSLLSSAPGWDWQSMLAFYPSVEVYTPQLRALEDFRRAKPDDAASRFVLAYHYQVQGHPDAALRELRRVVELQPGDMVAAQMLKALEAPAPGQPDAVAAQDPANAPLEPAAAVDPAAASPADAPQTDLVGKWIGKRQDSIYNVTLADDGKFTWMAKRENATAGAKLPDLQGQYTVDQNMIVLEDGQGGTMVGQLTAKGPDEFVFTMMGAPQDDPGISFRRNRG